MSDCIDHGQLADCLGLNGSLAYIHHAPKERQERKASLRVQIIQTSSISHLLQVQQVFAQPFDRVLGPSDNRQQTVWNEYAFSKVLASPKATNFTEDHIKDHLRMAWELI